MFQVNLIIGDWSGDGHNITDTDTIVSNLNAVQIQNAYDIGAKKLGYNVELELAEAYEDRAFPLAVWHKFVNAGMTKEDLIKDLSYGKEEVLDYLDRLESSTDEDETEEDEDRILYPTTFANLWLYTVLVGNPDFIWRREEIPTISIGGYGLFSQ